MKILGIDHGDKKIGLAVADMETKIATPYKILFNNQNIFEDLKNICTNEDIDKIVIGVPKGLQGNESEQMSNVLNFISKLREEINIEVIEQDEKLTSSQAGKLLQGTKSKGQDDDVAAMLILQGYLDKL